MDDSIRARLNDVRSDDQDAQNSAYSALMETTEVAVDWAYEAWDELVAMLRHESNRVRAIASQVLCNLSRSDPDRRIVRDLPALLQVTRDERFVTARHCLQSLWKVGAAGPEQRRAVVQGLAARFRECGDEKNCTLIRFDIVQALRNIHDAAPEDASARRTAHELMELETDPRYRKKYAGVWKGVPAA